ncbi:hypothetical protein MRX96_057796 [Rhipicephalus microplus]
MAKRFLYLVQGLLLCVPNVSPGSTTATTGYSPHSHHFHFCKSQPPHVEPCDVIPKLLPPGSAWSVTSSDHRLLKDTWNPPSLSGHGEIRGNMAKRFLYLVQGLLLCVPNVSPGSTTATTGYSPHSHHFHFCKSQPPHVEPCDVIPKLLPPGSAWSVTSSDHRLLKDTWNPPLP